MNTGPTPPSAGWYPDPSGKPGQRYWSGTDWAPEPAPKPKLKLSTSQRAALALTAVVALVIVVVGMMSSVGHNAGHDASASQPTTSVAAAPATPATSTVSQAEIQQQQQEQQQAQAEERERLDPNTYNAISFHDFAVLMKDPDIHMGEKIIIYGKVTQFDAATGDAKFRATTVAEPHPPTDDDEYNALIEASDPSILSNVVRGDSVQMYVVVDGTETYKSTLGADLTVPKFDVNIINVTHAAS